MIVMAFVWWHLCVTSWYFVRCSCGWWILIMHRAQIRRPKNCVVTLWYVLNVYQIIVVANEQILNHAPNISGKLRCMFGRGGPINDTRHFKRLTENHCCWLNWCGRPPSGVYDINYFFISGVTTAQPCIWLLSGSNPTHFADYLDSGVSSCSQSLNSGVGITRTTPSTSLPTHHSWSSHLILFYIVLEVEIA